MREGGGLTPCFSSVLVWMSLLQKDWSSSVLLKLATCPVHNTTQQMDRLSAKVCARAQV